MDDRKTIFLILGESGSGKDTIVDRLCKTGLKKLVSHTTRARRKDEPDTSHIFSAYNDYLQAKESGQIIAETCINNVYYWATKDQLKDADVYIIDPQGSAMLQAMELPYRFVRIYINVPKPIRRERALQRGDNMETYAKRAADEFKQFADMKIRNKYDYAVSNIDSAKACSIIRWIINTERIGTVQN